ncbi:MAG: NAD(+) synthase [Deltaproteobacteria bacterium]|nr:NAD(+) synthase [Deltaproteobacteria bacterium]
MEGFARIAAAVPVVGVASFEDNRQRILELWQRAEQQHAALVVFPELSLTGYTVRDLLHDHHLLAAAEASLAQLVAESRNLASCALVGMPLRYGVGLYNTAVVIQGGQLLGVVPKSYLPNHREFEERRWFRPGLEISGERSIEIAAQSAPIGSDLLFCAAQQRDFVFAVELCEDLFVPLSPSSQAVIAGATVVANLSASNIIIGKAERRRLLVRSAAERGHCAYLYVAAGPGESSTDYAFDGDALICEGSSLLAESKRFARQPQLVVADIDIEQLVNRRLANNAFGDCAAQHPRAFRRVSFRDVAHQPPLRRAVARHPFVPQGQAKLAQRCYETFEIQTNALATRLRGAKIERLVLGLSGGLDSTHAALVSVAALDLLGLPRTQLHCVTMPGLGSSQLTQRSAATLAAALGARFSSIAIGDATLQVLQAIGHPAVAESRIESVEQLIDLLRAQPEFADIVVENAQARLRTLLLMSLANQQGALVVGTGDLSEKALGWSTYAGDQISMYDVNAGVPKTLIQFVIRWVAAQRASSWADGAQLSAILSAVLDTPISPELLPAASAEAIEQLTEQQIGPYELHDFFLYHMVGSGARPRRLLDLAQIAFAGSYELVTLKRWLTLFISRFFANQFKRSCTADGPKVGNVALSPRGDWRMPSDADPASWLAEVDAY